MLSGDILRWIAGECKTGGGAGEGTNHGNIANELSIVLWFAHDNS
jgi:hypothetical protein